MFNFLKRQRTDSPVSMKNFHAELDKFHAMLESCENFALVRFGDGEMAVIHGDAIDLSEKCNGEHHYIPGDPQHEQQRKRLHHALCYKSASYYVGIACPCCVGKQNFLQLKQQSQQPEEQLTWANLFVNSNYPRFRSLVVPVLARRDVVLVGHHKSRPEGLPFKVVKH